MNITSFTLKTISGVLAMAIFMGCVKDQNFDASKKACEAAMEVNATFADVKALYVDGTVQIQDDLIIEGYVISSDEAGNFFSTLHFQDAPENPTEGLQLELDLRDSHLFYPRGSTIYIKLKGLYLGKQKDVYKLGGVFTSFGNLSVGRLPSNVVAQHLYVSCNDPISIAPVEVRIDAL